MAAISDSLIHYNVPNWSQFGLAIPNWGQEKNKTSPNRTISTISREMGSLLQMIMFNRSAQLPKALPVDVVDKIHRMLIYGRTQLSARVRLNNQGPRVDEGHARPMRMAFLCYPFPYRTVANPDLAEWAELIAGAISECWQHTDNDGFGQDISEEFARSVGSRLQYVLVLMATKFFGISRAEAEKPDFVIPEAAFKAYNAPERVPSLEASLRRPDDMLFLTEEALSEITKGIYLTDLPPNLVPFADGLNTTPAGTSPDNTGSFSPGAILGRTVLSN